MKPRLDKLFFVSGVIIGAVCIYVIQKKVRNVSVFPTDDNVDSIQYKDATGTCFRPVSQTIPCPKDDSLLSRIRPQE